MNMNNNTLKAIEKICIALIAISFFILIGVVAVYDSSSNCQEAVQLIQ